MLIHTACNTSYTSRITLLHWSDTKQRSSSYLGRNYSFLKALHTHTHASGSYYNVQEKLGLPLVKTDVIRDLTLVLASTLNCCPRLSAKIAHLHERSSPSIEVACLFAPSSACYRYKHFRLSLLCFNSEGHCLNTS